MSHQILAPSKVPDGLLDHCPSSMRMQAPEALYAPLYKADVKTDTRCIESPFSQVICNQGQQASSGPRSSVPSPPVDIIKAVPQECPSPSSKEMMGAKINAALHSDLAATAEQLKSQRSSSVGTARGNMRTTKSNRLGAKGNDDLQAVLRYNLALQARTLQLEKTLAFKEREVAALTLEIQMLEPRHEESALSRSGADGDESKAQSLPANLSRSVYAVSVLHQDEQLGRLKKFFEAHNLHEADPTGEGLEEGVLKQLAGHVTAGCQMAEEMLTRPSACHHMLPLVVMEHSALLPEQAALWQSVVQKLKLSKLQRQQISNWRTSLHSQMQLLQRQRHTIISQMMHTLLPGGLLLHADAPQTFCEMLLAQGSLPLMKVNMDASASAKRLEDNLAQERKLLAGASTVLLGTLLSPVQAALLMLHAWPAHCDCFAFATAATQQVEK